MQRSVFQCLMCVVFLTVFGASRTSAVNIKRAVTQGIRITDPTMGLHPFDFVYRIVGMYQLFLTNCTVSFFVTSVRCLTYQVEEFNREFQEMLEFPNKADDLSERLIAAFSAHKLLASKVRQTDRIFRVYIFCMLVTNVPMTIFGSITLIRRDNLFSFVCTFFDLIFCIVQLIGFTLAPARLYAQLHAAPSHIYWSSTILTHFDPHLSRITSRFTETVEKLKVGLSLGGLVFVKKSSILMAIVLIVPYVILSYQLYVESGKYGRNYNPVTRSMNRTF
ncbi:CBR-GUR-5 protein [Ditylenchus destructor]|uniref:CBR-GUR-5 protein n=1 Tax=Ditylenchus destructor TaxID=166010 RepID=A0AAD4QXZ0_9BILA|nr:CBR-GUR-5 protein [Ditylenchus destructor]